MMFEPLWMNSLSVRLPWGKHFLTPWGCHWWLVTNCAHLSWHSPQSRCCHLRAGSQHWHWSQEGWRAPQGRSDSTWHQDSTRQSHLHWVLALLLPTLFVPISTDDVPRRPRQWRPQWLQDTISRTTFRLVRRLSSNSGGLGRVERAARIFPWSRKSSPCFLCKQGKERILSFRVSDTLLTSDATLSDTGYIRWSSWST